jgi:PRTRC genetic system protein E
MFFSTLSALLPKPGAALQFNLTALPDGRLSLVVQPRGEFGNPQLGAGLCLEATAQEFDADLTAHLHAWLSQRKSLAEQVEAAALLMREAATQVATTTVARAAAPSSAGKGSGKTAAKTIAVPARAAPAQPAAGAHADPMDDTGDGDEPDQGEGEQTPGVGAAVPAAPARPVDPVNLF